MAKPAKSSTAPPTKGAVFSATITLKNGRVLYASNYGLKAFVFYPKAPKR